MKREIIYLSLHCHHQNDCCIKMGSDENHFNVSVGSHKTVSTNHNLFKSERRAEAVSNRGPSRPTTLPLGQAGSQKKNWLFRAKVMELSGVAFLQHQLNGVSFSQHDHNNVTVGKLRGKRAPRASLAKRPERYYGLCLCVRIILYVKNKLKNLIGLCSTSVYRISYLG